MNCDKNGKCSCKPGFKGKKCSDKDCVMSAWRWVSTCQCGPGKTRTRSRKILSHPIGKGNPCGNKTDIHDCNLKCKCKTYQSGDYCQNQNCVFGDWGAWQIVYACKEPPGVCSPNKKPSKAKKVEQQRKRPIIIHAKGTGKCGKSFDDKYCTELSCRVPGLLEWLGMRFLGGYRGRKWKMWKSFDDIHCIRLSCIWTRLLQRFELRFDGGY